MLSAEDAILLRGLRADFWLDIDGAEVSVPFEGRAMKFSCDYDLPIKVNMGVVGFPWKELREGVRLDFSVVVRKKVHFEPVEPADDKPTEQHAGHLYVHVRQPDGQRRSYLIQAADFNPYIKN